MREINRAEPLDELDVCRLADDDDLPPMTEAEYESKLEQYDHLEGFEDYNEMVFYYPLCTLGLTAGLQVIQFGFIALFAPAFPLVSLMGLVNNVIEIRSDSNKLCRCLLVILLSLLTRCCIEYSNDQSLVWLRTLAHGR